MQVSEPDSRVGNTSASKRRSLAQDALRVKINGEKHINALESIGEQAKTADKDAIPGLKLQADISLALLKKVLPDLRHIEVSGDDDSPLTVRVVKYSDA